MDAKFPSTVTTTAAIACCDVWCRFFDDEECDEFETDVVVYEEFHPDLVFEEQPGFVPLDCNIVPCNNQKKRITWYKVRQSSIDFYSFFLFTR